jgi:hypothetical protein
MKIDPWMKTAGLIATVLGITISIFTLIKIKKEVFPQPSATVLRGVVRDMNGDPLIDAIVTVEELPGKSTTTASDGGFYFPEVPGKPGDRVRVYVAKAEYRKYNEYWPLPGPAAITLEKQ